MPFLYDDEDDNYDDVHDYPDGYDRSPLDFDGACFCRAAQWHFGCWIGSGKIYKAPPGGNI